mmetsp:Transcript_79332/g.176066  ORF Transcript_79332/g.176066 Transcript_79332/m.176066 type:complete len:100 (-) Transcript_79332:764-1063(-)
MPSRFPCGLHCAPSAARDDYDFWVAGNYLIPCQTAWHGTRCVAQGVYSTRPEAHVRKPLARGDERANALQTQYSRPGRVSNGMRHTFETMLEVAPDRSS